MEEATDLKKRIAYLRKQLPEKPHLYAHLADCYIHQGKTKKAQKLLTEWLEKMPNVATGWLINGALHYQLYHPKQAYAAYKQALRVDENIALAHEKCAEFAKEEEDADRYIHHLRELNKLDSFADTVQKKLQAALLRQAALEHGLYSKDAVEQTIPAVLRKTLLMHNLLPPEVERMRERMPYEDFEEESEEPGDELPDVIVLGADDELDGFKLSKGRQDQKAPEKGFTSTDHNDKFDLSDWAKEFEDEGKKPFDSIDVSLKEPAPEREDIFPREERAASKQTAGVDIESGEDTGTEPELTEEENVDTEDVESFDSPLMKMLRGEIQEKPTSREVPFLSDDELSKPEEFPDGGERDFSSKKEPIKTDIDQSSGKGEEFNEPEVKSELFAALEGENGIESEAGEINDENEIQSELLDAFDGEMSKGDPVSEAPDLKDRSREEARKRVAEIASSIARQFEDEEESTPQPIEEPGKKQLIISQSIPGSEKPQLDIPQPVEEVTKPGLDIPQSFTDAAVEELDIPPLSVEEEPVPEAEHTPPVPTKTLAELYASQGEWEKAVDVYDQLLVKFPDNSAYKNRLVELKRKLDS